MYDFHNSIHTCTYVDVPSVRTMSMDTLIVQWFCFYSLCLYGVVCVCVCVQAVGDVVMVHVTVTCLDSEMSSQDSIRSISVSASQ